MSFKNKLSHGFTLIELLIVIALLGALAVGLLATVDPFEQLKKGTDTSRRNTTAEIYNAAIRYYAAKSAFPWTSSQSAVNLANNTMTDPTNGFIQLIVNAGELKPQFVQLAGSASLGKIVLTSTADPISGITNVAVCYQPESKSFQHDANAKFSSDGGTGANCISQNPTSGVSCYWCMK